MTGRPLTSDERAAGAANTRIGTELVSETAGMRIWHLRLQPGKSLPAHRHDRPYIWTVLTDGAATSRYGDGRIVDMTYRAGEARHPSPEGLQARQSRRNSSRGPECPLPREFRQRHPHRM